jgi:hypothetical protein
MANHTDLLVNELVEQGAYAKSVPTANTDLEAQGRDGVLRARAHLKKQGYWPVYTNQDRNDEEKARPDILAQGPNGEWEQFEIHNYRLTDYVNALLSYSKNVRKKWIQGLPKTVIMAFYVPYSRRALRQLQEAGITLLNGLSERVCSIDNYHYESNRAYCDSISNQCTVCCERGLYDGNSMGAPPTPIRALNMEQADVVTINTPIRDDEPFRVTYDVYPDGSVFPLQGHW